MTTPYSPSGSPMSTPVQLPNDGELINKSILTDGILKPIIDGVGYATAGFAASNAALAAEIAALASQTSSSGDKLIGSNGFASGPPGLGTIAAGTLHVLLQYIMDTAIADLPSRAVTASASSATISAGTARVYHVDTPTQATLTITLNSSSPIPPDGAEILFTAFSIANTKVVTIVREDASNPILWTGTVAGPNWGSARFKFIGSRWRLIGASGVATVMLINNP